MITIRELETQDPADLTVSLAGLTWSMVTAARVTLEAEPENRPVVDAATDILKFAEELIGHVHEGCDTLEQEAKRGFWRPMSEAKETQP